MKEFMFFIRKQSSSEETMSPVQHRQFLKACEQYIGRLKKEKKLISAQPVGWAGKIISGKPGAWNDIPFNEATEVIGGYYHLQAESLTEAIKLAKENPEFTFNSNTRIEVRPVMKKEEQTGYVYPVHMS